MTALSSIRQLGIIGTGRVARALGIGLGARSAKAPLLWGRTAVHVAQAVDAIGRCTPVDQAAMLMNACDVIVIAVADDAIGTIAADLAAPGWLDHAPLAFHASGSMGTTVLAPLQAAGALTAAIHPVMTFTGDPRLEVQRMAGARFAVTGSSMEANERARMLVQSLGGVCVDIAEERRVLYHAALCHAANHLVTLLAGAARGLNAAGVADPGALLAPLVRAALENGLQHGIGALSGPVLRGDAKTLQGHLTALQAGCPEITEVYRALAIATVDELERDDTGIRRPEIRALLSTG